MFINAYQSYLFNKILSMRIIKKLPINEALPGDLIITTRDAPTKNKYISVTQANLDKVNRQIQKNHAAISGILIGHEPHFTSGEMGEIEQTIIQEEKIDPRHFIIPEIPFLSSKGTRRALFTQVKNLDATIIEDLLNTNKKALHLKFELDKGCYATSFLREWMKSPDIRNY